MAGGWNLALRRTSFVEPDPQEERLLGSGNIGHRESIAPTHWAFCLVQNEGQLTPNESEDQLGGRGLGWREARERGRTADPASHDCCCSK